jgi:hypothetical protein
VPTDGTSGAVDAGDVSDVRVFMSYRRTDDANFTGRFHDKLIGTFGDANVFRDIDSIPAGMRFEDVITDQLADVDAVVALIGPTWSARLDAPTDFVRMEIVHALERGTPVIPVIIEDTPLPASGALPDDLQPLLARQAVRVRRDPDFHRDASRVIDGVREAVQAKRAHAAALRRAAEEDASRRRAEQEAERARAQRRRELEAELAAAETRAAEERRVAEALEAERAARKAELERLEEEATQRRIAEERARVAAIAESQAQRERDAEAAAARAAALRRELEEVSGDDAFEPPAAAAATAFARETPPVQHNAPDGPPPTPAPAAAPVAATRAAAASAPRTPFSSASKGELAGAALLLLAFLLAVRSLFMEQPDGSTAFSGPWSTDVSGLLLTVGLLAPYAAFRRGMHVPGVLAGSALGFLAYQAFVDAPWFWYEDYAFPGHAVVIAVLLVAAFVAVYRGTTRTARRVSHQPSRILQIVAAAASSVATWLYVDLLVEWNDPDPYVVLVFLGGAVVMLVLSVLRAEGSTVALAVLALDAALFFFAVAIGNSDVRDRVLNIAIASAVLAGAAGWRSVHTEPVHD